MTAATKRRQERYPWTAAEPLRDFQAKHGLTHLQLADVLKVSKTAVVRWLQNNRMPQHRVERLALWQHERPLPRADQRRAVMPLQITPPEPEPRLFIFQGYVRSAADLETVTRIIERVMDGQVTALRPPS